MCRRTSPGRERKFFSLGSIMTKSSSSSWAVWFTASTAKGERDLKGKESSARSARHHSQLPLISCPAPSPSPCPLKNICILLQFLTYLRSIEKASDNFWRSATGTHLRPRLPTFPTRSIRRKAERSFSSRITRPIRCLQEISYERTIIYTNDSKITLKGLPLMMTKKFSDFLTPLPLVQFWN